MTEQQMRDLLLRGVALADRISDMTPSLIDDYVVDVAKKLVENDDYWRVLYRVIQAAIGYVSADNREMVLANDNDLAALSDMSGFSPTTLVLVVRALLTILDWWTDQ